MQTSQNSVTLFQGAHFQQLVDMFSLPEIALLSDVAEHFIINDIQFDADYLFTDVKVNRENLCRVNLCGEQLAFYSFAAI